MGESGSKGSALRGGGGEARRDDVAQHAQQEQHARRARRGSGEARPPPGDASQSAGTTRGTRESIQQQQLGNPQAQPPAAGTLTFRACQTCRMPAWPARKQQGGVVASAAESTEQACDQALSNVTRVRCAASYAGGAPDLLEATLAGWAGTQGPLACSRRCPPPLTVAPPAHRTTCWRTSARAGSYRQRRPPTCSGGSSRSVTMPRLPRAAAIFCSSPLSPDPSSSTSRAKAAR